MKKFISLLLTFMIVLSMFTAIPFVANAAEVNLDPNRAYVKVEDQYYEVKKGDVFTYEYKFQYPDEKIASIDVHLYYDTEGLDFCPVVDEYGDDDFLAMYPALNGGVVHNYDIDGRILFNFSSVDGVRFREGNDVIFSGNFEVTQDSGIFEISANFYTLAVANKELTKLVYKGEIFAEFDEEKSIPELTPVDTSTEPPTGESSEEIETDEVTDIPSSEKPTDPVTEPDEDETDETSEPTEIVTEPTEAPTVLPTEEIEDISFHFVNSGKWETVCAFSMIDEEDTDVLWPGVQMEYNFKSTEGDDVYSVTVSGKYKFVVFHDPFTEAQTGAIEIQPDKFYDFATGEWLDCVEPSVIPPTEEKTETPTPQPTELPDESITVYLINSANWTQQNIYLWNDGDSIATWPGLAMVYTGQTASNGAAIFKFTYEKYYANVIFNSGVDSNQTADLVLENGKYYDNLTNMWYDSPDMEDEPINPPTIPSEIPTELPSTKPSEEPSEIPSVDPTDPPATDDEPTIEPSENESSDPTEPSEEPSEKPVEQVKVYLVDEAGWGGGHVYAWNEGGEQHNPWPGSTMTFEGSYGNYDVFSYTFDEAYDYIIFNNGANGDQTDNLDFVINGIFNNKKMEWENIPDNPSEEPSEEPTEPGENPSEDPNPSEGEDDLLIGDLNGDGQVTIFDATFIQRAIAKMDILTEEQIKVADVDGDGEIKIFDATKIQRIVAKLDI